MAKIHKRWILVGKEVLYKFPIDIASKLFTFHAVNGQFLFWQITQTAITRTLHPKKPLFHKFTYCYTFVPIYGSKL